MKTIRLFILPVISTIVLSSCTVYHVNRNTKLYKYTENDGSTGSLVECTPKKSMSDRKASISVKDDYVKITLPNGQKEGTPKTISSYPQTDFRAERQGKLYYAEEEALTQKSFRYTSTGFDLSVATMSVKNRFKIRDLDSAMVSDSFPSTNLSAFTPTLSIGGTHGFHWITKDLKKISFEISGGVFTGFGTTDINNKTTREGIYQFSRKAVYISYGAYVNLGVQKFDLGLAYGWDIATGPGSSGWLYQSAPFVGVMIGWDLVKFRE